MNNMNDVNMNDNKSLETMKKNIADNIKQLDDIKRRVELLGHGYSKSEITNNKSIMEAIETLDFSSKKQRSSLRIIKTADGKDVIVFHEEKEIAVISLERLNDLLTDDVVEVASYREF